MNRFDEQIARMKELYTYGSINEDHKESRDLEYHTTAADGNEYGIIKENSKYYIKITSPEKKNITESYNYIGGIMNKKAYQYESYNKALKDLELKLASINEAHDQKVNIETLDPFKRQELMVEHTEAMANEIARQRQIMYNASMIMNESAEYAVKGGAACNTDQPESEHGKSSDKNTKTKANPEFKGKKVGVDKKAEPFKENPSAKGLNEATDETYFSKGLNTSGNGEADTEHNNGPFTETVSESADETYFSKGLGATGTGEADTDHNNGPFTETVNEAEEADNEELLIDSDEDDDMEIIDGEEDIEIDGEDGEEYPEMDDFSDVDDEPSFDDEEEIEGEEEIETEDEDIDLAAKVSELELEIAELKAMLGQDDNTFDGEEGEAEIEEPASEEEVDVETEEAPIEGESDEEDTDIDDYMEEAIRRKCEQIAENIMRQLTKEEHDFGKHPGYRKKPMTTPPVGPDGGENVKDWNDESTKGEQPFGEKIGKSDPFEETVNKLTESATAKLIASLSGKKKA